MTLTFANPAILLLLLALPLLGLLKLWRDLQARRRIEAVVAPRLMNSLVVGRRPAMVWALFAIELAAVGSIIIALAGPRYGFREKEVEGEGRTVILAIDTSRSMLAEDLAPNRIQRALLAAQDLVLSLPNDRIGVIAFAGRAYVQAPLTIDHAAVLETLEQLDTEIIPRGGTNIAEAIKLATESFDKADSANHALIIFTDGDELEGDALVTARKAAEKNVMIITIGVGTQAGGIIPDAQDRTGKGYVVDSSGSVVRTRLDSSRLETLARVTRGLYLRLDSNGVSSALVTKALENLDKALVTSERKTRDPIERYRWPLFFGVVLLLSSWLGMLGLVRFRKQRSAAAGSAAIPSLSGLLVFLAILWGTPSAGAGIFEKKDPFAALADGNHGVAIELFTQRLEDSPDSRFADEWRFARATAAFRNGDYDMAIEDFASTLLSGDPRMQEQSHYNLGNAIAHKASLREEEPELMIRDVEEAIEHFEAVLAMNSENADAKFNRDALKKFLEELKAAANQQGEDDGQSGDSQQQPGSGEGEGESDQQAESGSGNGQGKPGQGKQGDEGDPSQDGNQQQDQQGNGDQGEDENKGGKGDSEQEGEGDDGDDSKLEGKLEAVEQPGGQGNAKDADRAGEAGGDKKDPRTGFSPSEARQLLRALTDEDTTVRPEFGEPIQERNFKDW